MLPAEGIFLWNESPPGSSGQLTVIQLRVETSGRRQNWSRCIFEIRCRALCRQHWELEWRLTLMPEYSQPCLQVEPWEVIQGLYKLFQSVSFTWGLGGHTVVFALVGERDKGAGWPACLQVTCANKFSSGKTGEAFVHFFSFYASSSPLYFQQCWFSTKNRICSNGKRYWLWINNKVEK